MRKRVYIAGPITKGDRSHNVAQATSLMQQLLNAGYAPFCPHLGCLVPWDEQVPYEAWMEWCLAYLETCSLLIRLPGDSSGADREVAFAREKGIPVVFGLSFQREWERAL
jgi:Rieske Fe-S protein